MPDWAEIFQEFQPTYARTYRRASITALGFGIVSLISGLLIYLLVKDALAPAIILWMAAAAAMVLFGRNLWLGAAKKPMVISGQVVKKHAVLRADVNRSKFTKPVLALRVTDAFELTETGRGDDLPSITGAQAVVASRYIFSRVGAGQTVTLVCLPSGEAMGMIHDQRLVMEDAPAKA